MRPCLLPALLLALAGPVAAQHHDHAAPPASTAAPAQRFATDAPLREHMASIGAAVEGLDHYRHGHIGAKDAQRLAAEVQQHVRDIVAQCRLPADADAALHAVIVPLATNAATLEKDPAKTGAIAPMRAALDAYARRFDDPGFAAER